MAVQEVAVDLLVPNEGNPNEQDERTFNALVESIQEEGWVQPAASVVPREDGKFDIVSGHHRWEAAKVLGIDTVPVWVLDPEKFDKDRQEWNVVKQNIIAGRLNPEKFSRMYDRMAKKYDAEVLQSLMGFTSSDAFDKMYTAVRKALPKELRKALEEVKGEVETIDDLSIVLNRLFKEHGETLDSDYMVFSWGGKNVMWVRSDKKLWDAMTELSEACFDANTSVTDALNSILASDTAKALVSEVE